MGSELVFVDDLSSTYTEPDESGYNTDSTSAFFARKSPRECYGLLQQMCERTASEFHLSIFASVDARSLEDGTMLLTEEPEEEDGGEDSSVRAVFEMVQSQLALWAVARTTVGENRERAQGTEDGVL